MKEWATQKKIEAAVKEDKARVDQMNARVAKSVSRRVLWVLRQQVH
jgi:hypothetical protein